MHDSYTAMLDENWDLCLDSNGNLKILSGATATAQNVCNECRLFKHDAYFRFEDGIDWFDDQLGKTVQSAVLTNRLRKAAQSVNDVTRVRSITINKLDNTTRKLCGRVEIETVWGTNEQIEI